LNTYNMCSTEKVRHFDPESVMGAFYLTGETEPAGPVFAERLPA
jgi:hypothetical protein